MSKQIEVTWIETLTQTAVFDVPDDLDVDADLDQVPDQVGVLYDQVICVTGGPVGPMFPVRDAVVSERAIDHWRNVGVEPDLQPCAVGLTRAEGAYLRKLGVSWGDLHENARADFQAGGARPRRVLSSPTPMRPSVRTQATTSTTTCARRISLPVSAAAVRARRTEMCAPHHQAPLIDLTKQVAALLVRPIFTNIPITQKGGRR